LSRVLPVGEAEIVSLLALSDASFLTSRLRSLALMVLVLLLVASLALPNSADDVSGAAVALLLAQSALALASRDMWGLVLCRAEIVLQSEAILAS